MQEQEKYTLRFAAAGCNRKPGSLCSIPSLRIAAYAANRNVIIVIDAGRHISAALPVHKTPVTSVVLVQNANHVFLIASSSDGYISVWNCPVPEASEKRPWSLWEPYQHWKAHSGAVVAADAFWNNSLSNLVIASAGLDARLCVWCSVADANVFECSSECCIVDEKGSSNALPECIAICSDLDASRKGILIAVGGTHRYLQLFVSDGELKSLRRACCIEGHRDWIRGVAFSPLPDASCADGRRYIATASKDSTVRIWSISTIVSSDEQNDSFDLFSELGPTKALFTFGELNVEVAAVALLQEHGNAVHSVSFELWDEKDNRIVPRIVTSSMDCSIAIWQHSLDDGWHCATRFGLMGGAGAHALGFFGAVFASEGCCDVLAHNFGGALHCWRRASDTDDTSSMFVADCAPGGHTGPVHDLDWDPQGLFFLSCSQDKTARIFLEKPTDGKFGEWARPQVHGHAIQAAAFCDKGATKYVSGAEESMLRLFEAPSIFTASDALGKRLFDSESRAATASVPELGLSNKAVYKLERLLGSLDGAMENVDTNEDVVVSFGARRTATTFPLEEELKQSRLWPETAKLYGHGNPISCVAVCKERAILASACYAQKSSDATIRLWDLSTGTEVAPLPAHDLTVTRMSFSSDGRALLSVSRDRSFAIHFSALSARFAYSLAHHQIGAHARLLYDGTWLFNRDFVVTCSRDKRLRIFSTSKLFKDAPKKNQMHQGELCNEIFSTKYEYGVSSVDSLDSENSCHIAVGFEDGGVRVFQATRKNSSYGLEVIEMASVPSSLLCSAQITRLRWRPIARRSSDSSSSLELAVGSADHSVRVLRLHLPLLAVHKA